MEERVGVSYDKLKCVGHGSKIVLVDLKSKMQNGFDGFGYFSAGEI